MRYKFKKISFRRPSTPYITLSIITVMMVASGIGFETEDPWVHYICLGIISIGIGFVYSIIMTLCEGEPYASIVSQIEQTSVQQLAPVAGMKVDELVEQLTDSGFVVDDPQQTIEQLADKHDVNTGTILISVFRE